MTKASPQRRRKAGAFAWNVAGRSRPTEAELVERFIELNEGRLQYRGRKWLVPFGNLWSRDFTGVSAERAAREVCQEAAKAFNNPDLDNARLMTAVVRLARTDPRMSGEFSNVWR